MPEAFRSPAHSGAFGVALSGFFDRAAVLSAVSAAERRVLAKFGAFVRRRAKSSIRKRKRSAPPGSPPSSHRGDLRRLIFFGLDPVSRSVVVGPVVFDKARPQTPGAPEALEHAGAVTRRVRVPLPVGRKATARQAAAFKRLLQAGRVPRPSVQYRTVTLHYRGNPFMAPALAAEVRDDLPKILRDCVTK